jgi:hypothetical protein
MMRYVSPPSNNKRIVVPDLPYQVHIAAQRTGCLTRALLAKRQDRLWLSLVAVPLAMITVTLQLDLWLLIPIAILCWFWAESQWLWLLGIESWKGASALSGHTSAYTFSPSFLTTKSLSGPDGLPTHLLSLLVVE